MQAYANPAPAPQRHTTASRPQNQNQSYFARDFLRRSKPSLLRVKPTLGQHDNLLGRPLSRRGRNGAAQTSLTNNDISQEDALFFSRLPPKLQRREFSAEERTLLEGQQERVILDAADEKFYKLQRRAANRSLPSLSSSYSGHSETRSLTTDDLETLRTESDDMDEELMSTFRWIDESEPDLSLDDYHGHLINAAKDKSEQQPVVPSPPARRNRSFTNFSLKNSIPRPSMERRITSEIPRPPRVSLDQRPHRLAQTTIPAVPAVPSLAQLQAKEAVAITNERRPSAVQVPSKIESWPRPSSARKDSISSINASAEHYLNPEARLKLRLYLATPSKFDEALEFGFPTLPQTPSSNTAPRTSVSSRPRSSRETRTLKTHTPQAMTFLRDDTTPDLSRFAEEKTSTRQRVITIPRPVSSLYDPSDSVPSSPAPLSSPGLTESSAVESDFEKDLDREHYGYGPAAREMTLRMTLTRPDLRADDALLYPHAAHVVAPQTKFIGRGAPWREAARPSTARVAPPSQVQSQEQNARDPLSLEKLFDDEPNAKPTKGGLRKLFSKRW